MYLATSLHGQDMTLGPNSGHLDIIYHPSRPKDHIKNWLTKKDHVHLP